MSERDNDGAPDFIPARVSRGRRSGVILPGGGGQDAETILLESVKAAPRRSSIIKDPSVQKVGGGRKKTVSFSSMPSEKKVSSAADCLAFMQGGCELKKVRPNSRVYCRFYTLEADLSCLRWEPSKKDGEKARLDVCSIREVRTGKSTETFLHNGPLSEHLAEEAAFSIIHGEDYQSLDLVALSADVANIWVTGLRYLLAHPSVIGGAGGGVGGGLGQGEGGTIEGSLGSKLRSEWLAAEFARVDEDGYGIVSEDMAVATICKLCPGIKEAKVRLRFKEIQRSKEKLTSHVTREEFQEAYCELCTRPDVYFLMVQLSKDREYLDPQDLRLFLETEQGLSLATAEGCLELLRRYEPSDQGKERGILGLDGFARYLQSHECQLLDPEHEGVCQDMNMPLSHYYISTSYRSYLLDDQVHGRADLGGLIKALQSGCRCLELGVTDGPEGEPLLGVDYGPDISCHHHHHQHHHHHAPVTIRSALEVVNKYAFLTSQYPLLVYLCQHCSPVQQRTMAQHLKKVLGSRLYTPESLPVSLGGRATTLPSPEQLKGRILIVGKKLPPEQEGSDGDVSEEEEEIGGGGPLAGRRMTIPGEEDLGVVLVVPPPSQPRKLRLHKDLSDLVAIARTGSRHFYAQRSSHKQHSPPSSPGSPGTPLGVETPYWTLCSLGEGEAGRLTTESPEDLVMFTKRTLTRVRPSSVRLDSSNPNPQGYWKGGVQLVALNQQTPGAMLDLHKGRFSQNGGCGYVLRPAVMRDEVSYFSAHTQGCMPGVPPQTLRIKVISAHNLPKPQGSGAKGEVIDPYVVLELHGVPADCAEQRTRTALQNQDDPLFDETFEFEVNMPELALLRFVVLDDDYIGDDFIGQYSVAFECLQSGYRNVPLLGLMGEPLAHASLFVHVAVTNRRGGGKAHRRGLSVRRVGRRGREYVTLRNTGIKVVDETFKPAIAPLKEVMDLREEAQGTIASLKEQCGLPTVAKLKQCIQCLATRLQSPDGTMGATMVLKEGYPSLEALVSVSEATRKLLTAYDTMIAAQKQLIENADGVLERIAQVQKEGMDFHEDLSRLAEKEGLKGCKLSKAVESFTWNITVLKGQSDLLRGAKMDSLDALRQLALACEASGLTSPSSNSSSLSTFSSATAELHYTSQTSGGRRSSTHSNGRV
ncbi:inactive phospholipase C-like protein 1 [Dunckerocampus dactyliophorus]|uniref:inactive phospholipase C-like protein 1 n=1 Tax=Dunckerocampus dactyliophorus TaxID=161453 RepID=UPI00240613C5|nr:inactive phospholipase C-like protein 1 [Dunckerocampus dactyliophorus]